MAVPLHLRNIPHYLRAPHCTDHGGISDPKHNEPQELLQFPKSTCVLWDGTSTGPPAFLHVAQNRKPRLQVWERVLWLIHKQVDSEGAASRVLLGSLSVEDDAEGVCFHIDGLDTRQAAVNSSLVLGDVMIPVQVSSSSGQDRTGSADDYAGAIKMLQNRCCGREGVELSSLLLVKGWCSFYSSQNSDKTVAHLQFDVVTLATVFKATPINPVPIVPTALAKNLGGPRSLSHMQGCPKIGYLTMDHTRKLLLVLESDPKVSSLPIVGIWVSGVALVHHPFVWASCLRYLHNQQLQDRVCTPPEGFLLVLYTPLHSKPEFYEVCTTSGKADLDYDLYTGYEITSLHKKSSGPEPSSIQWELSPVRNGPKRELFDAALEQIKSQGQESSSDSASPTSSASGSDDTIPRLKPTPHQAKAMVIRPMVPEVSMIWNEDSSPSLGMPPFSTAASQPLCLSAASGAASSAPLLPTPLSSGPALLSSQRFATQLVPSSAKGCSSSSRACVGSGSSEGYTWSGGQLSECMPRPPLPAQHEQTRTVHSHNNMWTSRPCLTSAAPPSGSLEAANTTSLPQSSSARWPHPPISQPVSGYSSTSYPPPPPTSQGHAWPVIHHGAQPQPCVMFGVAAQQGLQPQPQPCQPRLRAPSAMHFCRPKEAGPGAGPAGCFSHPAEGVHGLQHEGPMLLPPSGQGQPHFGAPSISSSHPCTRAVRPSPWPGQRPMYTGQGCAPHSSVATLQQQGGPVGGAPCFHLQPSARGPAPQPQVPLQCRNSAEGSCPPSWPETSEPASGHHAPPPLPDLQSQQQTYAQLPTADGALPQGRPVPSHPVSAGFILTPPSALSRPGQAVQGGNDSTQGDSTSSSKSSDDSGLSVTPDHSNPSPKPPLLAGVGGEGAAAGNLKRVNWSGVPGEVVELLVQQDAQLRLLQAQIQQLLAQQQPQASPPTSTPTPSADSTPSTVKRETRSTAVNTTLCQAESPWGRPAASAQCVSIQTSPQKVAPPHSFHSSQNCPPPEPSQQVRTGGQPLGCPLSDSLAAHTAEGSVPVVSDPPTPCREEAGSAGQTPSEIRHQGAVQLSSTQREDGVAAASGSFHYDISLEQPSPARSMGSQPQMSHSTPSPQSASMCVRRDEADEEHMEKEVSPDSKEYYDQLISNIRLFLNTHSEDAEDGSANRTDTAPTDQTCTQLQLPDSTLASPSPPCPSGGGSSNTTLMPHINYLSLMLGSEPDASLEINAMALKYLRDEQLTQLARLHQSPQRAGGATNRQLLRHFLAASLNATGGSDAGRPGASSSNLSVASRKYLEKYGLLGDGEGGSLLDISHTLRLQTDFSLAVLSEPYSGGPNPPSPPKAATPCHGSARPATARSPLKREVLQPTFQPSPAIAEERENSYEETGRIRRAVDLGASPALRPPPRRHTPFRDLSPEDTPIFPERYHGARGQDVIGDCSLTTEDDPILDIEKLKQMPKLL